MQHIELASNASMNMYPKNKATNFTIKLPQPLELDGEWEVGMLDMYYPNSSRIRIPPFAIIFEYTLSDEYLAKYPERGPENLVGFPIHIEAYIDFESVHEVVATLNEMIVKWLDAGLDPKHNQKISHHRMSRDMFLVTVRYFPLRQKIIIALDKPTRDIVGVRMHFTENEELMHLLGIDSHSPYRIPLESRRRPTVFYHNSMIYAYCDIVDQTVCGDTMAQLLASMALKKDDGEKMQHEQPRIVKYRRVNRKYISTISVWLAHENGEPVIFPIGVVILSILFRKRF